MKNMLTERERKLKWYRENKDKVNKAKRDKTNKMRIARGLPPMEEYYKQRDRQRQFAALAKKFIKARKNGEPDPGVSTPELEEAILRVIEEREKRKEYDKAYYAKRKAFLDERDRLILRMREEEKDISSKPSLTEIDLFEDEE